MDISVYIAAGSLAVSLVFGYLALRSREKKEDRNAGQSNGTMMSDIGYIKAGVDDLKRENRETSRTLTSYNERITRCEDSCKQAHLRIDELRRDIHNERDS